ncbi:hypothetical protein [Hyphomicrobium sp.]|jgi:hypothetical protein|uniref:hypothetical protein n=1 Tax=Hyphomicrobium sp. TaxID=82 RepID=UPI0035664988
MVAEQKAVNLTVAVSLISTCLGSGFAISETFSKALDAGARYGEALGAIEICDGAKLTDKAINLKSSFAGLDLDRFTAQAAKVYEAWANIKHCVQPNDPNPCRIIIQKSCLEAISEIGPEGSVMPGLLDFKDP